MGMIHLTSHDSSEVVVAVIIYIDLCIGESAYIYVICIYIYMLQEEQSLCFLKALRNIHHGQPRITFPSPFCVAGVGRSIVTFF